VSFLLAGGVTAIVFYKQLKTMQASFQETSSFNAGTCIAA
jgi:hypothetical protein